MTNIRNIIDPFHAVSDYTMGRMSRMNIFLRKIIFAASLFFSFSFLFLSPGTQYIFYDVSIFFIVILYFYIPYILNKNIDNRDFFARFAVVHVPVMIIGLVFVFFSILSIEIFLFFSGEMVFLELLPYIDIVGGMLNIYLIFSSFKKYREKFKVAKGEK